MIKFKIHCLSFFIMCQTYFRLKKETDQEIQGSGHLIFKLDWVSLNVQKFTYRVPSDRGKPAGLNWLLRGADCEYARFC